MGTADWHSGFESLFLDDFIARWSADRPWHITAGEVRAWLAFVRAAPQL